MKKNYLLILLSLAFNNFKSQTFGWAKDEGLWAYDYGMGIANDNAGNVYVAGKYEMAANFSGTTLPCTGIPDCNHDLFLAKYNSNGSLTWVKTCGGSLGDYAHCLACDGSNFLYVAGEIEGAGNLISFPASTVTLIAKGDNDILLAKYDLNGNLLWAKNDGGYYGEKALGVTYDNAGNVYMCGYYKDTCTFGGVTTIYGSGNSDMFIAKYDANGNFQWVSKAGGPGRDEMKNMKCDANGNIYVCGFYSNGAVFGTQTYSVSSGSYYDAFVAKYNSNGALQWVTTAGGDYDEVAWGITTDNTGLIYITGEFNASAMFGSTQLITSGNSDIFIACYDANGNTQWAKRAGGPLIDRARGIGTDGTNFYITGQFGNTAMFGSSSVTAADSSDVFFASFNNTGNFISAASVGGIPDSVETLGYESGVAICADGIGNVYATGGLLNGGTFGSTSVTSYDRTDVFVTQLSQMVGVHNLLSSTKSIYIYPNPGNGIFTIDLTSLTNQKVDITIYNCLGQSIEKKMNRPAGKVNIDLSSMEDGIYFVELKDDDKIILTKKVVVQK
ncbi:MAG: T9SS type A sorting domain-containing protein [Burkholderiales bacterium]|nr:T9SS type A sorting domain-containing protein [Bacteroidia bacterium]